MELSNVNNANNMKNAFSYCFEKDFVLLGISFIFNCCKKSINSSYRIEWETDFSSKNHSQLIVSNLVRECTRYIHIGKVP